MSRLEAAGLVVLLATLLPLAGYGLAARARRASAAERLALASLAGLAVLLWMWSGLNFFLPLRPWVALLSLAPVAFALLHRPTRAALIADLAALRTHRHTPWVALGGAALMLLAFWPRLAPTEVLYYDGTSNHDGYLWIGGARLLQQQDYMSPAPHDSQHPWANFASANRGWNPLWGRAGAETFLAATASLTGVDPVKIYHSACAALLVPWLAAVFLVVRTFYASSLSRAAALALVALQPLFLFFAANGNLPNLLGVLAGALVVVAVERTLRDSADRRGWFLATALGTHAVLFAYPEIAPFIAVPALLLVGRSALLRSPAVAVPAIAAAFFGLALNPATTIRGLAGLLHSVLYASSSDAWANIFDRSTPWVYFPSFVTLSVQAGRYFNALEGLGASLLLLAAAVLVFARARDRFGALATLSGCALLLAYTAATHFSYGPQKSAQFSAVFLAAALPVAAIQLPTLLPRWWTRAVAVAVAALFVVSLGFHSLEVGKWSQRKAVTTDWTALASFARHSLAGRPILVEPATFNMSFFHGMWAAYFLPQNPLTFAARGNKNGGYVRDSIIREAAVDPSANEIVLVGRPWADAFDAGSPRLFSGRDVVLLRGANRVTRLEGFLPAEGVPQEATAHLALDVHPPANATLQLELAPPAAAGPAPISWELVVHPAGSSATRTTVSGPAPWRFTVALDAGVPTHIEWHASGAPSDASFDITQLRIVARR